MRKLTVFTLLGVLLVLVLAACSPAATGEPTEVPTSDATQEIEQAQPETLRIALLPILDSLPFFVADENGYFADEGVEVEYLPVASALEREQLMQSGEIDGMLNELHSTALNNRAGVTVQTVMIARISAEGAPLFRVLAAPRSNITIPSDLAGQPIGISENTIIEYVTQRLLQAEGLSDEDIVGQSVPSIPERFQLLMEGQILVATLPDPLAQSAIEQGAILIVDDSAYPQYAVSVLTFTQGAIDQNAEGIQRFLRAWDRAAGDINADPEAYRALLLEKVNVPPNVQETYEIPPYPRAGLPTAEQWNDVVDWLVGKGLLNSPLAYDNSVNSTLLP